MKISSMANRNDRAFTSSTDPGLGTPSEREFSWIIPLYSNVRKSGFILLMKMEDGVAYISSSIHDSRIGDISSDKLLAASSC
jgi:hypothetical protein